MDKKKAPHRTPTQPVAKRTRVAKIDGLQNALNLVGDLPGMVLGLQEQLKESESARREAEVGRREALNQVNLYMAQLKSLERELARRGEVKAGYKAAAASHKLDQAVKKAVCILSSALVDEEAADEEKVTANGTGVEAEDNK